MAPNRRGRGANKGKQPDRNQGQNPTSATPNQSQGSGANWGKQPATPQSSYGVGRANQAPGLGPLPPRALASGHPSHNAGANAGVQPHSGSPAQFHSGANLSGRQQPMGPRTPLAGEPAASSSPAAKMPSGSLDLSSRQFLSHLAAVRERAVGAPASGPSTAGVRGASVGNRATQVARRGRPVPKVRDPASQGTPPGAWANFREQIQLHDNAMTGYSRAQGVDLAEIDNMLQSNISEADKIRRLRENLIAVDRVCVGTSQRLRSLEKEAREMFNKHVEDRKAWKLQLAEQAEMLSQKAKESRLSCEKSQERIQVLVAENRDLLDQLQNKDLEAGNIHSGVGSKDSESQPPIMSKPTTSDDLVSQVSGTSEEIATAGKHVSGHRDAAGLMQSQGEDDKESVGALEAPVLERDPFVSLESEGVSDAMVDAMVQTSFSDASREFVEAFTQTSVSVEDSSTQTVQIEVSLVETSTQTVQLEDSLVEASTQTVELEVSLAEASTQTVEVSVETKDSLVQTEPVIISEGGWKRGFLLVLLMLLWALFVFWSRSGGDEQMWLEANTMVYPVEDMSAWPIWLQGLRFDLSHWLQVDRVMLG